MEAITITLPSWNQIWSYFCPPESTDDVIIFLFKPSSQKFSRKRASTKITQGKASRDDINDVLTVFELVLSRFDSTPTLLMNLFIPLLLPYFLFLNDYWLGWGFVQTLNLFYLIFAFIAVNYSLYKRMRETGRRKIDIQRMIEIIRPVYAKRGLIWHFSENFFCYWLELKKQSSIDEQNISLSVEVHSDNDQESFINQQDSSGRIFEDGENIVVCAGKNLTGPDFAPPVQLRYVISFIIYSCMMVSLIKSQYYYSHVYSYTYSYF